MTDEWYVKELLTRSPVLAFAKGLDGKYLFANDAWFALAGLERDQVLGRTDYELFDFETAEGFVKNDRQVVHEGQNVEAEETLPRDGRVIVGHSTKFPLRDEDGNICGVGGITVDITARKAAQHALAASERRFRELIEHSPEAYVVLDIATGKFVDVNDNSVDLFKLSKEELLELGPAHVSPPTQPDGRTSLDKARHYIGEAMAGETPVFDWMHQAGDGELLPCRIWLSRVELESGPAVRASILDMRESELLRSAMERMQAQLDSIQDALPQLIVVFDPVEQKLVHCNRRYTLVLGSPPSRHIWQSVPELCEEAMRNGSARGEIRLDTSAYGERYFEVEVSVFAQSLGEASRLLVVASDVTEQRVLDLQLRQARRLESLGRLAGGVAHDFNNLLTVILGSVEFLEPSLVGDPAGQADLSTLKDAAIQARGLTSQLLAFARADTGRAELVEVDALVGDSMRMIERLIGEDVRTTLDLGAHGRSIFIDRGQLQQVILNLAVNARDAMRGGGELTLSTRVVELPSSDIEAVPAGVGPGAFVVLSVTDSGEGMSPETIEKAFEPFFTTKPTGEGTGLGLSTVHGIAQRSGGGIVLQSRLGHGTSARVWLPVREPQNPSASIPPADCFGRERSVLLVDDEVAVGTIGSRALREAGFVVHQADGPEAALKLSENVGAFDIIVSDVVMPTMSGLELVEHLTAQLGAIPVLYVSGYASEALAARGLVPDQVNLLRKPFSPAALVRRVCAALERT